MKTRIILTVLVCVFVTTPLLAQGPPAQSGPHVFRGEFDGGYFWFYDLKRGYVAFIGIDLVAACETGINDSTWTYQDNFPPSEEGLWMSIVKGDDVPTSVWPLDILNYDFCDYAAEFQPIAEGTSDVVQTDNDIQAWLFDHNRKNPYGLSAHGVLTAPDGERMIFTAGFHCVFDADVFEEKCKYKIVLN